MPPRPQATNPTGTSILPDELKAILAEVRERRGFAILDEIYQGLSYDGPPVSALALDDDVITVNSFSQLGLVEMTRKRTRESLAQMLCEPCSHCQGRGIVSTARTVAYNVLREILREARQFNDGHSQYVA